MALFRPIVAGVHVLKMSGRGVQLAACRGYSAPFKGTIDGIKSTWQAKGAIKEHQDALPCQPVPPLTQTIERFLASVECLLSEEEYKQAQKLTSDFCRPGSDGEKLQEMLLDRADQRENWLADWWIKVAYLGYREPVILNVNPGMVAPPTDKFPHQQGQIKLASYIISSQILYKAAIDNQEIPIERIAGNDQCMIQHHHILGCCRVPASGIDYVQCHLAHDPTAPSHVTVVCNNHLFHVDVIDSDKKLLSVSQIQKQLELVVSAARGDTLPVGMLTAAHRDSWYDVYTQLREDPQNAANFDSIHQSMFVISLDKPVENYDPSNHYDIGCWHNLAGGGSHLNTGNRWNDKILQYFVSHDGVWGFAYEHSVAEGPPVLDLLGKAMHYVDDPLPSPPDAKAAFSPPKRLDFNLTPEAKSLIKKTGEDADKRMHDINVRYIHYDMTGREIPFRKKMIYPDGFVQAQIQLAYYKMYGHLTATYESGTLRKFRLGRTDTIRSATLPVLEFCKAMVENTLSRDEKVDLLRAATTHHGQYTLQVSQGQSIDRHLLGLKLMAYECGMEMPQFLNHPVYTNSTHWALSTTTVPMSKGGCVVFGPVVSDGYGIYYNRQKQWIDFGITTWKHPETDIDRFIGYLKEAFDESLSLFQSESKL